MTDNGSIGFQNNGIKERFCYCREKARNQESDSIIPYSVDFEASAKLMISIGGHDNFQHFSAMVCRPEMQKTFIQAIISFITDNRLDGVDIFWKWPTETERFKYTDFIKELKGSMSIVNKNFILSIVAPPAGIDGWENGFDLDHTCNGMDYYGPWENQWGTPAGPTSPLYGGIHEKKKFNVDFTMRYYERETKTPSKFNLPRPFRSTKQTVWELILQNERLSIVTTVEKEDITPINVQNQECESVQRQRHLAATVARVTSDNPKKQRLQVSMSQNIPSPPPAEPTPLTISRVQQSPLLEGRKLKFLEEVAEDKGPVDFNQLIHVLQTVSRKNSILNAVASHRLTDFRPENDNNFNG
ncbi:hypothetical protein L5515_014479 [Caenorhabditis briggsae]|uniref:Chitinase II/V-like catalytic domain-containing protein n=1 Tax=Caenorhabditis briggsae TaxID=6238 RepID=A0AAE9E989_CAEBR|nr:hypothetical protein L5515_014479 [Caenorhabditis briggsae]